MTIRVDVTALGEDQFVEIMDPKFLAWGLQKQITSIVIENATSTSQLDVAEIVAIALIKSGNVLNQNGDPVVFPLTNDSIKDCPSAVIEAVTVKFSEIKNTKVDRKN